jgi:hypothetical protein
MLCINGCALLGGRGTTEREADLQIAIERGISEAFRNVSRDNAIAIVQTTAPDNVTNNDFVRDLEHMLVSSRYRLISRDALNQIQQEQRFQLSGDVDDETAVQIGKIAGARAIIIGEISIEGSFHRLRLRVLDTQSAELLGTASQRFRMPESTGNVDASVRLRITSTPSEADFSIYDSNNNVVHHGKTPETVRISTFRNAGYHLVITRENFRNFEQTLRVTNGQLTPPSVNAVLERLPARAEVPTTQRLNITSNPSDAIYNVFDSNGVVVQTGRTPAFVNLNVLTHRSYLVSIQREGFNRSEHTVRVVDNQLQPDRVYTTLVPSTRAGQTADSNRFIYWHMFGGATIGWMENDKDLDENKKGFVNGTGGVSAIMSLFRWIHVEGGVMLTPRGYAHDVDSSETVLYTDYFVKVKVPVVRFATTTLNKKDDDGIFPYIGYTDSRIKNPLFNTKTEVFVDDRIFLAGVDFVGLWNRKSGMSFGLGVELGTKPQPVNDTGKFTTRSAKMQLGFIF